MKTIFPFIVFLLCTCTRLFAYDYQVVYSDRTVLFHADGYSGMKMDSMKIQENDSVFYPIKRIQEVDYDCYTPYGSSWLGEQIRINEHWNDFINQDDTIRINTGAEVGESWTCLAKDDLYTIEAKVTGINQESFLGIEDEVKTIVFQAFDTDHAPLEHCWNDKIIKLSKNYGLIQGFDFTVLSYNNLYYEPQPYTLVGLSHPKIGMQNLTRADVWDFEPGDELHTREMNFDFGSGSDRKKIIKYLSREDTENKISYKIQVREEYKWVEYQKDPVIVYAADYETMEDIYPDALFDKLPEEVTLSDGNNTASTHSLFYEGNILSKSKGYCEINRRYEDESCWYRVLACDDCLSSSDDTYRKGLGGPYYYCDRNTGGYSRRLVYYKKGNTEEGYPLIITGIDDIKFDSPIAYDKTNETFQIKGESLNSSCLFELIDLTGRVLNRTQLTGLQQSIPIGHIHSGVYIYRLIEKGKIIHNGKIIK